MLTSAFLENLSLLEGDAWIALGVVLGVFVFLVRGKHPSDQLLLGGLCVLLVSGVLSPEEALLGFASRGVATVAALYAVVTGVQETGGIPWLAGKVLGKPTSLRRAQLRLMLPVGVCSAFLNNTPVVGLFIPGVLEWSKQIRLPASRLLIPLSYASILGGMCTLIGTSTNLVVAGLAESRYPELSPGMFELARLGLPCALLGLALILLFPKLLPDRNEFREKLENTREYTVELEIPEGSPLIGKNLEEGGLRHLPGAFVAERIRGGEITSAVPPEETLLAGDRLVFVGDVDSVRALYQERGLAPAPGQLFKLNTPRHQRILLEAVVSNTCPIVGRSIREGQFRTRYNAVVIAVARNGERLQGRLGDVVLRAGDVLLVEAHLGFLERQRDSRDFFLVRTLDGLRPTRPEKAPFAFGILLAMILAAAFGVPMLQASWAAAALMLMFGCCSFARVRRGIEWHILLSIGSALGMGFALEKSGAALVIAEGVLELARGNPQATLLAVVLLTSLFTELITNNAAAVLMFPIAMNAAAELGVSPAPFLFALMIAASASFATPIGYQTNLMVYGPGGYTFRDYLKIGLPLNLSIAALVTLLAPHFWPF